MRRRLALLMVVVSMLISAVAYSQTTYVTKSGYLAGVTEEALDKAIDYAVQKDDSALQQLISTGMVFPLKAGIPVHIVDTKFFSGKVKIRPRGSTVEVWTVMEAIQK
jgi:hypothetical protein